MERLFYKCYYLRFAQRTVRGLFAMQCAKNKVSIKPLALARAGCIRAAQAAPCF
jgi:hypothetical protein